MTFLEKFAVLFPYLLAATTSLMVAAAIWRNRRSFPGHGHFAVLLACVAGWAFFNFLEDGTDGFAAKFTYSCIQYLFMGAIPVLFLRFTQILSRPGVSQKRPAVAALWVVPLAVAAAVWFDADFGVVRTIGGLVEGEGFTSLNRSFTPGFWVFAAYSYTLVAVGLVVWGNHLFRTLGSPRWNEVLSLAAGGFPWAGSVLVALGLNPWPGHDPTPALFAVFGLVIFGSLSRNRVFTLLPEAQQLLMRTWPVPLLLADHRGRLWFANQRATDLWGIGLAQLGRPLAGLQPWLAPLAPPQNRRKLRLEDPTGPRTWEVEVQTLSGSKPGGEILLFHDITDHHREVSEHSSALETAYSELNLAQDSHRRNEEQIFYYSLHDSLTGLANRSLLLSRLAQAMELLRSDRGTGYSLIGLDLVNFRSVNDSLGYGAGDELVRQLAVRLTATLRESDVGARITADRFYALLNGATELGAVLAAVERLRTALEEPLALGGRSYLPRFRFSVVVGDPVAASPEAVIDDAETALARAKDEGASEVQVFQRSWRELRRENRLLLEDLSRAFSTRQIRLAYQPIVEGPTGRLAGVEALIRWDHPALGPIDPARMIGLAESEGLIAPLGLWALREATGFLNRSRKADPRLAGLFVSVNVSPKQLRDPDFDSLVLAILDSTGLPPEHLHLEITESSVVVHQDQVIPHLESLRRRGVRIMLDDFGTGYSSLQALHDLPVDTLKIDRAFIENLPQSRPIIASVLEMTRTLGLESVAEGVETPVQLDHLRSLGCTHIQGYLFSKALSETDFAALVRAAGADLVLGPQDEELPEL